MTISWDSATTTENRTSPPVTPANQPLLRRKGEGHQRNFERGRRRPLSKQDTETDATARDGGCPAPFYPQGNREDLGIPPLGGNYKIRKEIREEANFPSKCGNSDFLVLLVRSIPTNFPLPLYLFYCLCIHNYT